MEKCVQRSISRAIPVNFFAAQKLHGERFAKVWKTLDAVLAQSSGRNAPDGWLLDGKPIN